VTKSPPLVRQEPDRVQTKFAKAINTYFFPLDDDLKEIVVRWIDELQTDHLFGPNDPLFPKTKVTQDGDKLFRAAGIEPSFWSDASPVRAIFKEAFAKAGLPYIPPCNSHDRDSDRILVAVTGGSPITPGSCLKAAGEFGAPPVVPSTRTVAGASEREARLGKDGSPWT
jgi:hypothetical protein